MLLLTELGARLKEARLARGYSLDDLQDITKIQKRYLVGIEEGNYSIMPGTFYARAFIKQYAEAVGLDAEELLDQFKKDVPEAQKAEVTESYTQSPTRRNLASKRASGKSMEAMPKIIVALFIIVIIGVIWMFYLAKSNENNDLLEEETPSFEYDTPAPTEPEEETAPAETEEEPAEEPVEETPTQTIAPGVVNGEDVNFAVTNTTELKVRVELAGASWIAFRDRSGVDHNGRIYNAGEKAEYDATAEGYVRIRLGSAANSKVFVNGEELVSPSDRVTQNFIIELQQAE